LGSITTPTTGSSTTGRTALISDGADLIFFYSDNQPECFQLQNSLTSSITSVDRTGTVMAGVGGGSLGQWQKYLDVTTPGSPVWYLWYNQGGQNVGTYDCYQYNGTGSALTLLGSGISAVDFTLPNVGTGGSDRIPAKTEGRPQFDGLPEEVMGGGRKRFFRVYGEGSDLTLSQYHSADQEAPETLSTLTASSIAIEDTNVTTGLVGNLGEVAIEALSPSAGDAYVVSVVDGDGSLVPGSIAIIEGDVVEYDGADWAKVGSGVLALFDSDLTGYYRMEETATTRQDATANNYDITQTGTVAQGTGQFGFGSDFPGTAGNYLSRALTNDFRLGQGSAGGPVNFSISCWINPDTVAATATICCQTNSSTDGWQFQVLSTGALRWHAVGAVIVDSDPGDITAVGGFFHVAVTCDGSFIRLYVNGAFKNSVAYSATLNTASQFRVGTNGVDSQRFDGVIDDLAIFQRGLYADEISSIYNSGVGKEIAFYGFTSFGTHAQLSTTTALISPYTDGADDGKTASFAGTTLTGILINTPTNTSSQITATPDNGATQYSYIHAASTDSLTTGDQHTVMLDVV
jgi:hypothetical protein